MLIAHWPQYIYDLNEPFSSLLCLGITALDFAVETLAKEILSFPHNFHR